MANQLGFMTGKTMLSSKKFHIFISPNFLHNWSELFALAVAWCGLLKLNDWM